MTFKALEIHLNGKKLFTVGHKDWNSLQAHVWGHRWQPDRVSEEDWPDGEPLPTEPFENINLHCWVSVPKGDGQPDENGTILYDTEAYDDQPLSVGDEITITVVDTAVADKSNGPQRPAAIVSKE